ncbi:hypothetical protein ACLBXM_20120 [Xanthobacteraceae bacterium A53D]
MSILDEVADIVVGAVGEDVFYPATLVREAVAPGPNDWTGGTVTTTEYACTALATRWSAYHRAGGLVAEGDRKVLILAASLPIVPEAGDTITVQDETFALVSDGGSQPAVSTDPARAVWVCRGRA